MELKYSYKASEVGPIPEDWDIKEIGDIVRISVGRDLREERFSSHLTNTHHFPVYSNTVSNRGLYGYYDFPEYTGDSLTVVGRGVGLGTSFTRSGGYGAIGRLLVLFPEVEIDVNYLSEYINQRVTIFAESGGIPQLTGLSIAKYKIPVPPTKAEQQSIAEALSDADAYIESLEKLIAKKRDLKQAAMQQLLTGKTRLPGFEGEWEVKRLGVVGKCLRGVSYKGDSDLSTYDTPHTKRLLRSNNVQNAVIITEDVQFVNAARVSSHQTLQQDDILICMANGSKALVGKAGIFMVNDGHEYTFGAFMGCFRTNSDEANPAFVFHLFLTGKYRNYINNLLAGSSINNLRPSSIESLEFPMPPLPEQTAIATVLSDMDAEIAALEQRRNKTKDIKQAMMQELLTGRIRLV
ncbi:MAG: hypothetical protein COY19_06830 [Candidatus Marinimicrobia bacterium CG_4_10_14_0_2_um_filter_48_9]|nr:MAG: hypothetical protein COY19_06830 [Candidatus Marinimicrobia bacterium CG_4_10_14_0_2_um_filter_48_9]